MTIISRCNKVHTASPAESRSCRGDPKCSWEAREVLELLGLSLRSLSLFGVFGWSAVESCGSAKDNEDEDEDKVVDDDTDDDDDKDTDEANAEVNTMDDDDVEYEEDEDNLPSRYCMS